MDEDRAFDLAFLAVDLMQYLRRNYDPDLFDGTTNEMLDKIEAIYKEIN